MATEETLKLVLVEKLRAELIHVLLPIELEAIQNSGLEDVAIYGHTGLHDMPIELLVDQVIEFRRDPGLQLPGPIPTDEFVDEIIADSKKSQSRSR